MQILQVPEIDGFSDIMDLLASTPKLQERLNTLKEMQDGVNASLGDLEEVRRVKAMKHQAEVALADARETFTASQQAGDELKRQAQEAYDKAMAEIDAERVKLKEERQALERREKEQVMLAARNEHRAESLKDQERVLNVRIKEAVEREKVADRIVSDFTDRKNKVLEIFE